MWLINSLEYIHSAIESQQSNNNGTNQQLRVFPLILYFIVFLGIDFVLYGLLIPLTGAWLGSTLSLMNKLTPFTELLLVIASVCGLFLVVMYLKLERKFWKRLFMEEKGFYWILMIRDNCNVFALLFYVHLLYEACVGMASGMKPNYLGEGIGFVFWNGLIDWKCHVPEFIKSHYRWTRNLEESNKSFWKWFIVEGESISEQNLKTIQMINSAKLVLGIAGITSSVIKIVYFNALHTFVRSMKIFTNMQDLSPPRTRRNSVESVVSNYVSDFTFNVKQSNANSVPLHAIPIPLPAK